MGAMQDIVMILSLLHNYYTIIPVAHLVINNKVRVWRCEFAESPYCELPVFIPHSIKTLFLVISISAFLTELVCFTAPLSIKTFPLIVNISAFYIDGSVPLSIKTFFLAITISTFNINVSFIAP